MNPELYEQGRFRTAEPDRYMDPVRPHPRSKAPLRQGPAHPVVNQC